MKTLVISYATVGYTQYQARLSRMLQTQGIPHMQYNPDIISGFCAKHSDIINNRRGAGYWLWKPYIIINTMLMYPDTTVVYLDASTTFTGNLKEFLSDKPEDFYTVQTSFPNSVYTKRDCFVYMDCDSEQYWNARQVWAGVVIARYGSKYIMDEWLQYGCDRRIITDEPNVCGLPNLPDFTDHRHDQSILSNLVVKHGLSTLNTQFFIDG